MTHMIITYDLDNPGPNDNNDVRELLEADGWSCTSPGKRRLPASTVMRPFRDGETTQQLRDAVLKLIEGKGYPVKSIMLIKEDRWALHGPIVSDEEK